MLEVVILLSALLRWEVSLYGYSGQGVGPMYGDYEAQRHWMEVSINLPLKDWYWNTTDNDLNYWGLDYPPLTGYHSLLCGLIASFIDPSYVELHRSRGYESRPHKLFMRSTVLVSDLLTFVFGTWLYFKMTALSKDGSHKNERHIHALIVLTYPGLILIDHGHFQYNCVSLGLVILSIIALMNDYNNVSSIFFCMSLSYKQMTLYYSLPYFFYFLGKCIQEMKTRSLICGLRMLINISVSVIFTFITIWSPFIYDWEQLCQVLHRIFPVARGVFEDKVSNVWCVLNIVYKFKTNVPNQFMALFCTAITFIAVLPACLKILFHPNKESFLLCLINSSLGFFLFSFQVHEKSILLVSLPILFYFSHDPLYSFWFLFVSTFSMLPLFMKDELLFPFLVLTTFYVLVVVNFVSFNCVDNSFNKYSKYCLVASFIGCYILTYLLIFCKPPEKYPDLFPVMISLYSACHFLYFFFYFNYRLI